MTKPDKAPKKKAAPEEGAVPVDKFAEALATLKKKHGKEVIQTLHSGEQEKYAVVSTGSIGVDRATGIGGLPLGRIVEIYGPQAAGKSTLCCHVVANAQKAGLNCAYIDAEHAWDPSYAQALGVDLDRLAFCQPDFGEQALDVADQLAASGAFSVIVVDSIAALTPKAEIDGDMVDGDGKVKSHPGLQARMMGSALRKLNGSASKHNCLLLFVNQLRMKIGVMYGSPETTPGGESMKFYASMRLDIRRVGGIKQGDAVVGNETRVKIVKNKLAPPFKEALLALYYGEGFDRAGEMLDLAEAQEIITVSGGRYRLNGDQVAFGREAARKWAQGAGSAILVPALGL